MHMYACVHVQQVTQVQQEVVEKRKELRAHTHVHTHIRAYTQVQQEVVEKRKELRTLEKLMVKLLDVSMRAVL